jgi:membrane peptidoglycan carboxypeptidase
MGMHFDAGNQNSADWWKENESGTFTLGPEATSPLDLANSYATIAASGTRCEPTPVTAVLDRNGQPLKDADGKVINTSDRCTPNAIQPGVANTLANMMVGVVDGGTGTRARIPGHVVAGKTGTTQDNATAAFGGMTPKYSVAVLYFDPTGDVKVGGHGGGTPAQIFHDAMAPILANQPNSPFPPADPAVAAGTRGTGYAPPPANPDPAPSPSPAPGPNPAPPADSNAGNPGGDGRGGGNNG